MKKIIVHSLISFKQKIVIEFALNKLVLSENFITKKDILVTKCQSHLKSHNSNIFKF
ncbi:hypothetical protein C1645_789171 [Glomus cerebriforme]|uniref:Uncharacterized protein n=1 Tax=Glomus cerebriforme TaxID=658196 RepID=A0A397S6K1_9GLOM|nr:hypothetical protein C1645_789171 [Glomus cerebriforme]